MKQKFYSNGKLLLTGEYVVLDGAKALGLPTKFGQDLTVEDGAGKVITWQSFDHDGAAWFEDEITFTEIGTRQESATSSIKSTLIEILAAADKLNPELLETSDGYHVSTHLTFPKYWGLGTSSTLINNVAQWFKIDPFELLRNSLGGSGYDIACAQHNTPIIYRLENGLPKVSPINFSPPFIDNLWFVYLNRKQSSKAAIASYYLNRVEDLQEKINSIDRIT
ncbi:MAG TPA: GYDIA family GHMP kinase, partial [Flavobacterium sp.]